MSRTISGELKYSALFTGALFTGTSLVLVLVNRTSSLKEIPPGQTCASKRRVTNFLSNWYKFATCTIHKLYELRNAQQGYRTNNG